MSVLESEQKSKSVSSLPDVNFSGQRKDILLLLWPGEDVQVFRFAEVSLQYQARIKELKSCGFDIRKTKDERVRNADGSVSRHTAYRLFFHHSPVCTKTESKPKSEATHTDAGQLPLLAPESSGSASDFLLRETGKVR